MIVKEGQNILDVCMELFGTLENLFDFIDANNLTLNSKLNAGQVLTATTTNIGNENVKNFVALKDISYNNDQSTGLPPLSGGDYNNDYSADYF